MRVLRERGDLSWGYDKVVGAGGGDSANSIFQATGMQEGELPRVPCLGYRSLAKQHKTTMK